MSDDWTPTQERISVGEGWCLSARDDGTYEIQKRDDADRFGTDQEALAYVRMRARQGGLMHQRALRLDGQKVKP